MTLTWQVVCTIIAVILFVWSALTFTDIVSFGTAGFLTNLGLAVFAAGFIPVRKAPA